MNLTETIQETKGLAYFVAIRFKKRAAHLGVDYDDVTSEAMIGLIKSIKNFKPEYGNKFSTYAVPVIENQLRQFFRDTNSGPKYSRRAKELLSKLKGTETIEEIVEKFGVKRSLVEEAFAFKSKPTTLSMDKVFNDSEEDFTFNSFVGYKEDFSVVYVNEFLSSLNPKLRKVVEMTVNDKTQHEIAKEIGCSQVNVYRLLKRIRGLYQEFSTERS